MVTGGAGFIGSHLVNHLVSKGFEVCVIDNLSSGRLELISDLIDSGKVKFVKADLKEVGDWVEEFGNADVVYHFAANPEVRVSVTSPKIHFEENILATFNVLEASRLKGVKVLVFASSSTVYGDASVFPTPEDYHPLEPISIYGAAKLASEVLINSYSKVYGLKSLILRFANIVGPHQTHGVIVDFIRKLRSNPRRLVILGDGTQRKSYLHVADLLSAIDVGLNYLIMSSNNSLTLNVGNDDWITVRKIADIVVEEMGLKGVEYVFKPGTPDGRGWVGDVKFMLLDNSRLKALGWRPKLTSEEAVRSTVRELLGRNSG